MQQVYLSFCPLLWLAFKSNEETKSYKMMHDGICCYWIRGFWVMQVLIGLLLLAVTGVRWQSHRTNSPSCSTLNSGGTGWPMTTTCSKSRYKLIDQPTKSIIIFSCFLFPKKTKKKIRYKYKCIFVLGKQNGYDVKLGNY